MLVLSRKAQPGKNGITINTPDGYEIRIKVSGVCRTSGSVRIALDADPRVKIVRDEITARPAGQFDVHPFTPDAYIQSEATSVNA